MTYFTVAIWCLGHNVLYIGTDIFMSLNEKFWIVIKVSLKCVTESLIDKSALVQVID